MRITAAVLPCVGAAIEVRGVDLAEGCLPLARLMTHRLLLLDAADALALVRTGQAVRTVVQLT